MKKKKLAVVREEGGRRQKPLKLKCNVTEQLEGTKRQVPRPGVVSKRGPDRHRLAKEDTHNSNDWLLNTSATMIRGNPWKSRCKRKYIRREFGADQRKKKGKHAITGPTETGRKAHSHGSRRGGGRKGRTVSREMPDQKEKEGGKKREGGKEGPVLRLFAGKKRKGEDRLYGLIYQEGEEERKRAGGGKSEAHPGGRKGKRKEKGKEGRDRPLR